MGLSLSLAKALLQEHVWRPFSGNLIFVGRQTTPFSEIEAKKLIESAGLKVRDGAKIEVDEVTRSASGHSEYITEKSFFDLFCSADLSTVDVTDYEECSYVHDFCTPIPAEMFNCADMVWLGSCLDNMSDPIQALENATKMLKIGGRLIDFEICVTRIGAYLAYSPGYFLDWLAANKFENVKMYVMVFDRRTGLFRGDWHVYEMNDDFASYAEVPFHLLPSGSIPIVYWIADKGTRTDGSTRPIQGKYRPKHLSDLYDKEFEFWRSTGIRPSLKPAVPDEGIRKAVRWFAYKSEAALNKIFRLCGLEVRFTHNNYVLRDLPGFVYLGRL
ncbi:hypothetical protein OAM79_02595 [Litorivicinus sp.]|nr:hypothetical protein [Litorivicinus sp.]